ncbi:hypothetical protein GCM10028807_50090 [Spirosoma daeguense]
MTQLSPNATKVSRQNRFGYTVRNKQIQNNRLKSQIDDFLCQFDIHLPASKQAHNENAAKIYRYDEYGDALRSRFEQIVNLRYAIGDTKGYYARFRHEGKEKLQPLAFWYSKHRLDHVWNWRKSQIIRNRYYRFLESATDETGVLLLNYYKPVHMVLTVPHINGLWQSKRFYARELIKAFTAMRKEPEWKRYVYAGEYGIEVKRSESHGLHIHMHSFLLQHPQYSIDKVRQIIERLWRKQTGNLSGYSGIHYETLYTWKRDEQGGIFLDKKGKPVKDYIKPGQSDLNQYLSGVLECIKYHFKPDCIQAENGAYDIELIDEILCNTKNLRMYSRFGAFYRQSLLNFNVLQTDDSENEQDLSLEAVADEWDNWVEQHDTETSVDNVEANIINPFTGEPAKRSEFEIAIGKPTDLLYRPSDSPTPYEGYLMKPHKLLFRIAPRLPLKDVIKFDLRGQLHLNDYENNDYQPYKNKMPYATY